MSDVEMVFLMQSVPMVIGIIALAIMVIKEFRD